MEIQMNNYDLNKQVIAQLANMDTEDLNSAKSLFAEYHQEKNQKYYMLLCHDLRYYTIFATGKYVVETLEDEVMDCLNCLSENIKAIDKDEVSDAVEIWIEVDGEIVVAYFFGYEKGVIECM